MGKSCGSTSIFRSFGEIFTGTSILLLRVANQSGILHPRSGVDAWAEPDDASDLDLSD